jgi:hypothetical protein
MKREEEMQGFIDRNTRFQNHYETNLEVMKEGKVKMKDLKAEIKSIKKEQLDHYHKLLTQGKDTR